MAKEKTKFVCMECGYESVKWLGKCTECGNYNTFVEEKVFEPKSGAKNSTNKKLLDVDIKEPVKLGNIEIQKEDTIITGIDEMDRVLGNGFVKGSLILLGGEPGIGKSTLLLQMSDIMAKKGLNVLYVTGEESTSQIKIRADRLNIKDNNIKILPETSIESIVEVIKKVNPDFLIIDSIQTIYTEELTSVPGSVGQVREITNILMNVSKNMGITTVIIGHVTKDGNIAGPKVLEHMVDTVLYFEGESMNSNRIIRTVKNRFGSTNEIGVFEMTGSGLKEIKDPSRILLDKSLEEAPGSVLTCAMEGTRPFMIEVQALVSKTNLALPRRTGIGVDYNRLALLVAIIEKHLGIMLGTYDVYVNVVGGLKINDPSIDLAIIAAIVSSFKNKSVSSDCVVIGEVGLLGEVRNVTNLDSRIREVEKMGFKKMYTPIPKGYNKKTELSLCSINALKLVREIFA